MITLGYIFTEGNKSLSKMRTIEEIENNRSKDLMYNLSIVTMDHEDAVPEFHTYKSGLTPIELIKEKLSLKSKGEIRVYDYNDIEIYDLLFFGKIKLKQNAFII